MTTQARFLNFRLDDPLRPRVERFEQKTGVSAVSLSKHLLSAAMDFFEAHGYLVFPIDITVAARKLHAPSMETMGLNEDSLAEDAANYAARKHGIKMKPKRGDAGKGKRN